MRLQMSFEHAVELRNLGKLALLGASEGKLTNLETGEIWHRTLASFILVCPKDAPLVQYFDTFCTIGDFGPQASPLLHSIFTKQGARLVDMFDCNERFLTFTWQIRGRLRDPRRLLRAVGRRLLREISDVELWNSDLNEMAGFGAQKCVADSDHGVFDE